MEGIPVAAYVASDAGAEIIANVGVLAAREASRDEIDELAEILLRVVPSVTVLAGRRYEFATGSAEVAGYEIRVSFQPHTLPDNGAQHDAVIARILGEVDAWARALAVVAPAAGEDLASRIVRGPFNES